MYLVEYKKTNGDIFYRKLKTKPLYSIGQKTSMGWVILSILVEYNGNYFSEYDLNRFIRNKLFKESKKEKLINFLIKLLNKLK